MAPQVDGRGTKQRGAPWFCVIARSPIPIPHTKWHRLPPPPPPPSRESWQSFTLFPGRTFRTTPFPAGSMRRTTFSHKSKQRSANSCASKKYAVSPVFVSKANPEALSMGGISKDRSRPSIHCEVIESWAVHSVGTPCALGRLSFFHFYAQGYVAQSFTVGHVNVHFREAPRGLRSDNRLTAEKATQVFTVAAKKVASLTTRNLYERWLTSKSHAALTGVHR